MVNTAFVNYLDQSTTLTESFEIPIIKNKTTFKQTLSLYLNISKFDSDLLTAPRNLKDFIHQYNCKKEIFDLNKRHDSIELTTNKHFFSNNYMVDVFLFIAAVISLLVTTFAIYLMQTQETQNISSQSCLTASKRSRCSNNTERNQYGMQSSDLYKFGSNNFQSSDVCSYTLQKSKLCRGCMFSNAVKIMMFISDVHYYGSIKLCKTAGSIHLFKITGMLKPENVKLN